MRVRHPDREGNLAPIRRRSSRTPGQRTWADHHERPHPVIDRMVLFGASGDLTSRLLLPAVAQLAEAELLPSGSRSSAPPITTGRPTISASTSPASSQEHATVAPATRDDVVRMLSFQPADVTDPSETGRVIGDAHPDTLVYLALPPGLLHAGAASTGDDGAAPAMRWRSRSPSAPTSPRRNISTRSSASSCPSRRSSASTISSPANSFAASSFSGSSTASSSRS